MLLTFPSAQAQDKTTASAEIPAGTILPVRLNESLSSSRNQAGDVITARIMQDVPLANGRKIHAGAKVIGRVVEVSHSVDGHGEQVSVQFDRLISSGRTTSIKTNLRALAGFVAVMQAQTPTDGPVSMPIATTQVGGDVAYTAGGVVTTEDGEVVGKSVNDGVLVQVRASNRQGEECGAAINENNSPQAMWVFSSDACGTYGVAEMGIVHPGKTQPGVIVLMSAKRQLKLLRGAGMLLQVQE
jgi:hypothetical protein